MILGISGFAGSGKDQVAEYLRQDLLTVSVSMADPMKRILQSVYAFTDEQLWGPSAMRNRGDPRYPRPHAIYEADEDCYCCGVTYAEADKHQCYLTPRFALQSLGTEWGRDCYPDTWADLCIRTAKSLLEDPHVRYDRKRGLYSLRDTRDWEKADKQDKERAHTVVVPDVRQINEMNAIWKAGGKVIRVKRPGAGLKGATGQHGSETEQATVSDEKFDAVIENDGTLEDLRARANETFAMVQTGAFPWLS